MRPVPFNDHPHVWGPSHDEPCPCGSTRLAGDCHVNRSTERWQLPPYTPLLTDKPTDKAHPLCFVAFTNDCSERISKEHWLSEGILRLFGNGKTVRIGGLAWQEHESEERPFAALGANILCSRHNSALSRLDQTATQIQTTLERYQLSQLQHPDPHGNEFDLHSGEELERWLLKLIWGATAAASSVPDNLQT